MIRRGVTAEPPREEDRHPLFSPAARQQLRAIEVSGVWRGLRAGIEAQREALLSTPLRPQDGETLEARWGAIQQLSLLLHGGPQLILQHSQLLDKGPAEEADREYVAAAHRFEG